MSLGVVVIDIIIFAAVAYTVYRTIRGFVRGLRKV